MVLAESIQLDRSENSEANYHLNVDAVIWVGDFNYRINGVIGAIVHAMKQNMFEVLLDNDQFSIERKIGRLAYGSFEEGKIRFAPTYKINKGQDSYNVSYR